MNLNFQIRTGKHAGKTLEWLQQKEPSYLAWIKENRPEMLKGSDKPEPIEKKEITFVTGAVKTIVPNINFWNEGPSEISKPYLKKNERIR